MASALVPLRQLLASNPSFSSPAGPARIGAISFILASTATCSAIVAACSLYNANFFLLQLSSWLLFLSTFHTLEYYLTVLFHPQDATSKSFLLTHSPQYHTAIAAALAEWCVEWLLFGHYKRMLASIITPLGIVLCTIGQFTRSSSMFTAGRSFTHLVSDQKSDEHTLITHGLYSYMRHPSYAGWFLWSLATQLILCNPLALCAYAYVSYKFFSNRIIYEEYRLFQFFGQQYEQYWHNVPFSGVPGVKTENLYAYVKQQQQSHQQQAGDDDDAATPTG